MGAHFLHLAYQGEVRTLVTPSVAPLLSGPSAPHFALGPLVAAYIQYSILKMCPPPFWFLAPLLLNPGDGPDCCRPVLYPWVAEPFSKWGGTSTRHKKNCVNFKLFEPAIVTSQALKYDVITYAPYEGLNSTKTDNITPLWKRIGEPPEIQISCYRGEPGQQRHSSSS